MVESVASFELCWTCFPRSVLPLSAVPCPATTEPPCTVRYETIIYLAPLAVRPRNAFGPFTKKSTYIIQDTGNEIPLRASLRRWGIHAFVFRFPLQTDGRLEAASSG